MMMLLRGSRLLRPSSVRVTSLHAGWRHGLRSKRFLSDGNVEGGKLRPDQVIREQTLHLKQARHVAMEAFNRWRRKHTVFLISSGIILGAGIFGTALYIYLDRYPSAVEYFIVEKTVRAFDQALSFESRKNLYMGLPEPNLPNFEVLFMKAMEDFLECGPTTSAGNPQEQGSGESKSAGIHAETILTAWADLVDMAMTKAEGTWILAAKLLMRERLMEEINQLADLEDRLNSIWDIYPTSVERNLAISEQIDQVLDNGGMVPGSLLERLRPQIPSRTCDVLTSILIHAIAFFPGPINQLILFLDTPTPKTEDEMLRVVNTIVTDLNEAVMEQDMDKGQVQIRRAISRRILESTGLVRPALVKTLMKLKQTFDDLPPAVRAHVLNEALKTTITYLPTLPRIGGIRPFDLYVRAIDNDLIGPLRRDARISEDILREVKSIFLAMPGDLQARVLLTAIRHPLAKTPAENFTPEMQAELVRDLLSSGGVVAVKLAQMLAEHPRVPREYQLMLGSLRDENQPMPATVFWWQIPSSVRSTIMELGPCLGTGSVKQANKAILQDGSKHAIVVLRSQVEDEALSSISALETSDELGPVATRLGKLVYGEFNLFGEGEVLREFAHTQIGQHPLFHVVRVRHHSPKCLLEEVAQGRSVAAVLEQEDEGHEEEKKRVFEILVEYHRTVMTAFITDGVIHSDVHLGNANYYDPDEGSNTKNNNDGDAEKKDHFVLFDVGQFERIGLPDAKAILWTLAAMSTPRHRKLLRNIAVAHLANTASLKDKSVKTEKEQVSLLKEKLSDAFEEAIAPNAEGEVPDKRTAYMLFLRAAEKRGVEMPNGSFSVAKMIDGIVSQQERYDLPQVVDDCIEGFLRQHMTWGEYADIGARHLRIIN